MPKLLTSFLLFAILLPTISFAASIPCTFFESTTPLRPGMISPNVATLQKVLNLDPSTQVSLSGAGSPGNETTKYGIGTFAAVKKFQEKYASTILTPGGLTQGTGLFGPATRRKVLALCKAQDTFVPSTQGQSSPSITTPVSVTGGSASPITSSSLPSLSSCSFLKDSTPIRPLTTNSSIITVQQLLNTDQSTVVAQSGPGSPGNESPYYGPATVSAIKRFQEKYASSILTPNGLTEGTGLLGVSTKNKLYEICSSSKQGQQSTPQPTTQQSLSSGCTSSSGFSTVTGASCATPTVSPVTTPSAPSAPSAPSTPSAPAVTSTPSSPSPSTGGSSPSAPSTPVPVLPEIVPPSTPTDLYATSTSPTTVVVSFTPSTDDNGVSGYKIFRDGKEITTLSTSLYTDPSLTESTTYIYTVSAYDQAGNTSAPSAPVSVTTQPSIPTPVSGSCGSSNSQSFTTLPTTNLCTTGTASSVSGTGPWNWSCTGSNGGTTASCSAQKTAVTPTPTATLTASAASVVSGSPVTLTYTSTNATACTASWGTVTLNGTYITQNLTTNQTYTLSCTNATGGSGTKTVTVAVTQAPTGSVTLSSSACTIPSGASSCTVAVSWVSTGVTTPSINQNGTSFSLSPTGSSLTRSLTQGSNTFTLTSGATVLATQSATASCTSGTTWNGTSCAPNVVPVSGSCGSSNSQSFTTLPTTNLCTTGTASSVSGSGPWNWSCTGSNGGSTSSCSAQKTTVTPLPTATLTASAASVVSGSPVTLTYTSTNATTCTASWGTVALNGTYITQNLTTNQTYTLSCTNATGGSGTKTVTVAVTQAPTGSVTLSSPTCVIQSNGSNCAIQASWFASNATLPSVKQNGTSFSTLPSGSLVTRSLIYGANTFTLNDSTTVLNTQTATSICVTGTTWNGTVCSPVTTTDTTKPTIIISSPVANTQVTIGTPVTVTLTATDNTSISTVSLYANNVFVTSATTPTTGSTYSLTFPTIGKAAGSYTLAAVASDPSGNKATSTTVVVLSSGATTASLSLLSSTPAVHPGQTATLTWSSSNITSCTSSWGGTTTSGTFTTPALTASTTYTLTCKDSANNTVVKSTSVGVGADPLTPGAIGTFSIKNYIPAVESSVTPVSLAYLNDHVAGSRGPVVNCGGHFCVGGQRIRFYGVNMSQAGTFTRKADADKIIPNLKKQGFNAIRIISLDTPLAVANTYTVTYKGQGLLNADRSINTQALDAMDYFIYQAQQNGIYVQIALTEAAAHYGIDCSILNECRGIDMYMPELIQKHKNWTSALLNHTNPYSGRTYKTDPGIVSLEINNENGISFAWSSTRTPTGQSTFDYYAANPVLYTTYLKPLEDKWEAWVQNKYGTPAAAGTAWGTTLVAFTDITVPKFITAATLNSQLRKDWYQFMGETEKAYLDDMYAHIKTTLGSTALVYGSQANYSPLWVQSGMDINDIHDYLGKEGTFSGVYHNVTPTLKRPIQNITTVSMLQIANPASGSGGGDVIGAGYHYKSSTKPNIMTEYSAYWGNDYMAEIEPLVTMYSGFQDVDALYLFNYHPMNDYNVANTYPGYYGTTVQSVSRVSTALSFRRGDFTPGAKYIAKQTKDNFLNVQTSAISTSPTNFQLGGQARAFATHNVYLDVITDPAQSQTVKLGCQRDPCPPLVTTTGEITWTLRDSITANTPKTKMAVGYYRNRSVNLGSSVQIDIGNTMNNYAVIGLTSLTDSEVLPSTKMLLSLADYYDEPGQFPRVPGQTTWSWGNDAQRIESVPSKVKITTTNRYKVTALDSTGAPKKDVPVIYGNGFIEFVTGPAYDTGWYLIEKI